MRQTNPEPIDPPPSPRWTDRVPPLVVVAAVLVGGVIRVLGTLHQTALDADEAVTGTMAQALVARHEWPAFYWGQPFGGTLEVGLVGGLLAILPDALWTLRLLPIVTSALVPFVLYAIGRRLYGRNGAVVAAVAVWCPTQALAWFQARQMLFYQPTLLLGSVVVLLSLRFFDRPTVTTAAAIGLLSGLGFWMSTNILYFAVPAGFAMLCAGRDSLPRIAVTVPAGMAGAAPWLVFNLQHGFASLYLAPELRRGTFTDHLSVYLGKAVPMLLGAASPSGWDLPWRRAGIVVAIVLGVALLVAAVASLVRWRPGIPPPVDAFGLLATPVLYSVNPIAGTFLIPRYALMPLVFFALAAGRLASSPKAAVVALATILGLSAGTLARPFEAGVTRSDLRPVERALAARRVNRVYADYWVTFPLAYRSEEAVLGSPFATRRRPLWDVQVARAPAASYVFMCNSPDIDLVATAATGRGLQVDRQVAGGYVLLFLSGRLTPQEVSPTHSLRDGNPLSQRDCER